MSPEQIVARLLYRDALMLVIDKPAGLPVHPGPGGGETLYHHLDALRFGLPCRPEAAHRLDKDTSGCLVLGRHAKALARLGELFKSGAVDKLYWAVVEGGPATEEGEIELALSPRPQQRWRMRVDPKGQGALTRWRVLGRCASPEGACPSPASARPSPARGGEGVGSRPRGAGWPGEDAGGRLSGQSTLPHPHPLPLQGRGERFALLELRPVTGRTHQLRVHCAAMGWPILGDSIYGSAPRSGGPGLQLHARAVAVPLYPRKPAVHVEAPVPEHMRACLFRLGIAAPTDVSEL